MKRVIWVLLIASFLLIVISCNNERGIIDNASKKTLELPKRAAVVSDLTMLRQAINQKKAINGEFPNTLEELGIKTNRPIEEYNYDKDKGTVKHRDYTKI